MDVGFDKSKVAKLEFYRLKYIILKYIKVKVYYTKEKSICLGNGF
jgi:hypothetical protein